MSTADVLVVGAGPAGIASVLALRQELPEKHIAWVDPEFASGRLGRISKVPCNTKVDLLAGPKFFRHGLLAQVESQVAPALQALQADATALPESTDPSELGWTTLGACKSVFDAITEALLAGSISCFRGKVECLKQSNCKWMASIRGMESSDITVESVILATGAEPKIAEGDNALSVEDVFDGETLEAKLRPGHRIAVLGNSHSAAIALANLGQMAAQLQLVITNFARRPVRCAEWLPNMSTYKYTSTGLKGFGAVFGRDCMAKGTSWLNVRDFSDFDSGQWDWVVDCRGYKQSRLPDVEGVSDEHLLRDEETGQLGLTAGLRKLFAVGIPWGEAPGRLWGKGCEDMEGFKGEDSFVGFHMFFDRALLIAKEIRE